MKTVLKICFRIAYWLLLAAVPGGFIMAFPGRFIVSTAWSYFDRSKEVIKIQVPEEHWNFCS